MKGRIREALGRHKKAVIASFLLATVLGWVACNWNLKTRTPPPALKATAPAFSLPDHTGTTVTLASLLEKGPAVVVFYRGYW